MSANREELLNTPIESGLRSLFILSSVAPDLCDLSRLVAYDYLLVHSGDIENGPTSLHPASPFRSGELIVRRNIVESGLRLVVAKGIANISYTDFGISYSANELSLEFLKYFEDSYSTKAARIAKWINAEFTPMSDVDLQAFMQENIGRWGAEFSNDPLFAEEL